MSEKFISGWPEGTKEIRRPDGKKEIVLPEATDMNEHSREELVRKTLMRQLAKDGRVADLINPQFSVDRGDKKSSIWDAEERRKVNSRHETIAVQRKQERGFREMQKEKGAEKYDRLFER